MEIVLTSDDIGTLIKERYAGVSEVKFSSKNVKATLIVSDITKFNPNVKKSIPVNTTQTEQREKTVEELNTERLKNGGMVSGGENRAIVRIG